jgi:hypothetical protein
VTGENNQNEFLSLLYGFLNGAGTFNSSLTEYKEKFAGKSNGDAVKEALKEFQGKYDLSIDGMIDSFLPEKYRPVARVAKNWPWSFTVDLFSAMLKEYGKDGLGGYKTSGDVVRDFLTEKLRNKIFQR